MIDGVPRSPRKENIRYADHLASMYRCFCRVTYNVAASHTLSLEKLEMALEIASGGWENAAWDGSWTGNLTVLPVFGRAGNG